MVYPCWPNDLAPLCTKDHRRNASFLPERCWLECRVGPGRFVLAHVDRPPLLLTRRETVCCWDLQPDSRKAYYCASWKPSLVDNCLLEPKSEFPSGTTVGVCRAFGGMLASCISWFLVWNPLLGHTFTQSKLRCSSQSAMTVLYLRYTNGKLRYVDIPSTEGGALPRSFLYQRLFPCCRSLFVCSPFHLHALLMQSHAVNGAVLVVHHYRLAMTWEIKVAALLPLGHLDVTAVVENGIVSYLWYTMATIMQIGI